MKPRPLVVAVRVALGLALVASIALLVMSRTVGIPAFLEPRWDHRVFADPNTAAAEIRHDGMVVNRAAVCVKPGTTPWQIGRLAAAVGGRVLGYPVGDRCYIFEVPSRSVDGLMRLLDRLGRDRIVESAAPVVGFTPTSLGAPGKSSDSGSSD